MHEQRKDAKKINSYLDKLKMYQVLFKAEGKILQASWMRCIINAVYIDVIYDTSKFGKPIISELDFVDSMDHEWKEEYFTKTYSVYHPLRNNVETLDSIEEVRQTVNFEFPWGHRDGTLMIFNLHGEELIKKLNLS